VPATELELRFRLFAPEVQSSTVDICRTKCGATGSGKPAPRCRYCAAVPFFWGEEGAVVYDTPHPRLERHISATSTPHSGIHEPLGRPYSDYSDGGVTPIAPGYSIIRGGRAPDHPGDPPRDHPSSWPDHPTCGMITDYPLPSSRSR
jgi:hypothetical protein